MPALVLLLFLLLPGHWAAAAQELPEEQLTQVNAAIARIQAWLDSAANNRSTLEQELRATTQQIDAIDAAITDNEEAVAALEMRLGELDRRRAELQEQRAEQEELVRLALRASYMTGRESYLKVLLNQEDPALTARMLHYYADFNAERIQRIAEFRDTATELDATVSELRSASLELTARQAELKSQALALGSERDRRSELLTELEASIASRSGELDQLQEDRQRLETLIEEINEAIASIPSPDQITPFAEARGRLPWPVQGQPLNRFGAAYSDGNLHRQGVILQTEEGAAVRAVHPGRVVFSDWLRGSGLLVVVDHGNGYLSLYANNKTLVKNKGDWVNRGEALATAGSDGGMGQPGIYFEIRHNGQAQDPASWCEA